MINPIIRDRLATDYSNIGAIVCRTPKTLHYSYIVDNELKEYDPTLNNKLILSLYNKLLHAKNIDEV